MNVHVLGSNHNSNRLNRWWILVSENRDSRVPRMAIRVMTGFGADMEEAIPVLFDEVVDIVGD
jgi:hypothetical protein